jgi:hypothetical protein
MLGDKNWDEREGDSYKNIVGALADLVAAICDKKTAGCLVRRGDGFLFFWNAR